MILCVYRMSPMITTRCSDNTRESVYAPGLALLCAAMETVEIKARGGIRVLGEGDGVPHHDGGKARDRPDTETGAGQWAEACFNTN